MALSTTALRHPLAIKKVMMQYKMSESAPPDATRDEIFEVFAKYDLQVPIARGTYGYVAEAVDTDGEVDEEGEPTRVAIKKIPHLFDHGISRQWLCAARELQMMRHFSHPNVMSAEDLFIPLGDHNNLTLRNINDRRRNFEEVYIVMSLMSNSLRGLINQQAVVDFRGESRQPIEYNARAYLLFQLLLGVGYLHKCGVMHRDMKPENVLIDESWTAKICDFGQGRGFGNKNTVETLMDNCTQWYAAPETLTLKAGELSLGTVDKTVFHSADVWSIGCIAAEMLIGKPLFEAKRAGGLEQLCTIMAVMGKPTPEEVDAVTRSESDKAEFALLEKRSDLFPKESILREALAAPLGEEDVSEEEIELILNMLHYDPRKRITIAEALALPFFSAFAEDESFADLISQEAQTFPFVKKEELETHEQGREFIWNLFVGGHPEVQELIEALEAAEARKNAHSGTFVPDQ